MIRLNQAASQYLQLITSQNGASVDVSYSDKSASDFAGDSYLTNIAAATTTTICATPAAGSVRYIDFISIVNTFAGSNTVTVQVNSAAAVYQLLKDVVMSLGDRLEYTHASGWKTIDSAGSIHTIQAATLSNLGDTIHAATEKTTLATADEFSIWDSVSLALRRLTWGNIITTLQTAFSSLTFSVAPATAAGHAVPLSQTVGRDKFINGAYQVAQKNLDAAATVTAGAAINYSIDRWYTQCTGQNITAQRVAGTAPFRYAYKLIAGATGATTTLHGQRIEGKDVAYLENGDVAVQVRIKGDVNRTVTWKAYYANAEDTFSTKTEIATGTINATTTDTMYQYTFNAGANAKNGIAIEYTTGALTNITGFVQYTGHQLEAGNVATAYEHKTREFEEKKCTYRFIYLKPISTSMYFGAGVCTSTTSCLIHVPLRMAYLPNITYTGNVIIRSASIIAITSIVTTEISNLGTVLSLTTASGLASGDGAVLRVDVGSSITFEAEI